MSTEEGRKKVEAYKKQGYIYIGGEHSDCSPQHYHYWEKVCRDNFKGMSPWNTPRHKDHCECGEKIEYNCWIWNPKTNRRRVVGAKCIKKFTDGKLRTCAECGSEHKNTKNNYCNDCRRNRCSECCKKIKGGYKKCYSCNFRRY